MQLGKYRKGTKKNKNKKKKITKENRRKSAQLWRHGHWALGHWATGPPGRWVAAWLGAFAEFSCAPDDADDDMIPW